ncbi:RNA-directed DNA polymerase, eukaryota, Reverse transcriptase zinc-binding domain protein [Artemisia annua]|uniref:RNA-directed DNA polymerase, eukaryota, Reverse transcriptase zinc-binding domain protein n=1 Tax=Artemisia annua TaxID=35608 RepID=A0A2U1NNY7_ARTAN|nr:RNA-directed DNA polymerase, eukaryota, Reverse transcriptase zinc-binding domain protein [Artemisia annua]
MRKFLWTAGKDGRGVYWVSWDKVTRQKRLGGLGISKMSEVNAALLVKWAWRFKCEQNGLWRKVVLSIHGGRNKWEFLPIKKTIPGCWKSIAGFLEKLRINDQTLISLMTCRLGDGNCISFWKDVWFGERSLMHRWPILFAADNNKNSTVADRIKQSEGLVVLNNDWNLNATTVEAISEVQDVRWMLTQVKFSGNKDVWMWGPNGDQTFSVAAVKDSMRKAVNAQVTQRMKWVSWVPLKVNILLWRIEMDRVATRLALVKRIQIPDTLCPMCNVDAESTSHLFVTCGFSYGVWSIIWAWCKLHPVNFNSIDELLEWLGSLQMSTWGKRIIRGIVMVTCWAVWKERNKKIFKNGSPKVVEVVAMVKSLSFLWFCHRSSRYKVEWNEWVKYPLYIL